MSTDVTRAWATSTLALLIPLLFAFPSPAAAQDVAIELAADHLDSVLRSLGVS